MYWIPVFYTYVLLLNGQAIKGVNIYTVCDVICCLEHAALPVPSCKVSYRVSEKDIQWQKKNSFTNGSTVWQNVWYSLRSEVLTDIANLHINFRCTKRYSLGDELNSCGVSTGESTWYVLVTLEHGWWLVFHQRELSHTAAWAFLSFLVQDIHQNCYESILSFPFLKMLRGGKKSDWKETLICW